MISKYAYTYKESPRKYMHFKAMVLNIKTKNAYTQNFSHKTLCIFFFGHEIKPQSMHRHRTFLEKFYAFSAPRLLK